MIWITIIIVGLLLLMLVRTFNFKPVKREVSEVIKHDVDIAQIISNFSELIQFKTISSYDEKEFDYKEFEGFKQVLPRLYPEFHKHVDVTYLEPRGILYKWKGKNDGGPTLFMAHYDVVPVNVEDWDEDPFSGLVKDGELWGRGTLDTKGTLCCMLESAEYLMKQGFTPNDDIYFAFAGDEETLSISAPKIVAHLKEKGIRPRMVLDEGGVVVAGQFPGVDKSLALIGTAEKGGMNIKLTLRSKAGHSSAPPSKQSVVRMAELIKKLNNNQMKARFTGPVNDMFNTVGRHSSFLYRFIFANKNILGPLLKWMFKKQGGQMNAITRTTIAMTKLDGSKAFNVLPPTVTLGLNVRLLQGDTIDDVMNHIYGIVGDEVEIEVVEQREASVISNTNNEVFNILTNVIYDTFGDVVVSPFLMTGATDSRHYTEICDSVFRFMGMRLHSEELSLIHSHNERIRIETIEESMNFYINLIGKF